MSSTAAAYPLDTGGFADGTDAATVVFDPGKTEVQGPSLRLLTNATVEGGSIVVTGSAAYLNTSTFATTTSDFANYSTSSNLSIAGGSVALVNASDVVTLASGNNFGNATLNGTAFQFGTVTLNGTTSGSFTTEAIAAPKAGWGHLMATADLNNGTTLTFALLYPNGTVAVSNQSIGGPITLDPLSVPSIRLRGTLTGPSPGVTPAVAKVTIGQRAGDTMIGTGVGRTAANTVTLPDGSFTIVQSTTSFTKTPSNPVLAAAASSWYSGKVETPNITRVGSEWWGYFGGATCKTCAHKIGRAVSSDLVNWTVDSAALFNGTMSWDSNGVAYARVMAEPNGSGYRMYFHGSNATIRGIGVATSPDGLNWTESSSNPILRPSASGWDDYAVAEPVGPVLINGTWWMWYSGNRNGQERDLGAATSTDGYNWTKYASNPVMARSGTCDSASVAAAGVVAFGGTLYLYYSGSPGSSYRICLATSGNGINWSKQGSVITAGGGWEGSDLTTASPLLADGHLYVYYNGWAAGANGLVQVGRGEANWISGTVRGTIDFGTRRALALNSVQWDALQPPGGSVEVSIRSSTDGSTWTAFENVTSTGTVATTPARRYVEYIAYLNATRQGLAPALSAVRLLYTSVASAGRYESSAFPVGATITGVKATATLSDVNGSFALDISTDNRATWTRVVNGTFTAWAGGGTSVYYACVFEGTGWSGPVLDALELAVERRSTPSNVTVRLGSTGLPFLNVSGPFSVGLNVSLPAAAMNAEIQAALALSPTATSVDVPIFVTSSSFGAVALSEPRVRLVLRNPIYTTFQPAGASLSTPENTTVSFAVNASTYPAGIPVNITWLVDGQAQPSAQNQPTFGWFFDFFAAGLHTVRCQAENGDSFSNRSWIVNVQNVNRRPTFVTLSPSSPLSVSHTGTVALTAVASDLDLEALNFTWRLDGAAYSTAPNGENFSALPVGSHLINVTVTDGIESNSFVWAVTSTNAAPVLGAASPAPNLSLSHTAGQVFMVEASDADGDPLSYAWAVDGASQSEPSSTLTLPGLATGAHLVRVRVADALASFTVDWTVDATNAAPRITVVSAPPAGATYSHTAALQFEVAVVDDDGDTVLGAWQSNGGPTLSSSLTFLVPVAGLGPLTVNFTASDGESSATWNWNGLGVNAAPVITSTSPAANSTVSVIDLLNLTASAQDADGDPITYTWEIDGVVRGGNQPFVEVGPFGAGVHTARLTAADGIALSSVVLPLMARDMPPLIAAASPDGDVTASHTLIMRLGVSASDYENEPLRYTWKLGTAPLLSTTNAEEVGPLAAGSYVVTVEVSDGVSSVTYAWNLTVTDGAPLLEGVSPAPGPVDGQTLRALTFTARAVDPDGDPVVLTWYDGNEPVGTNSSTTLSWATAGTRFVSLVAVSTGHRVGLNWTVHVTSLNTAPSIKSTLPSGGVVAPVVGEGAAFVVEVDDDGVLPVTITWKLDGRTVGTGSGYVYTPGASEVGAHTLTATVSDGEFNATKSWEVQVAATAPVVQSDSGLGLTVALLVVAAVAAVAAFFIGRRKGKSEERFEPLAGTPPPPGRP